MKLSKLLGERLKETPVVANTTSYALLLRAGYIKQVSNGIFSLLPLAQKVSLNIQNIIREEMNNIDGQEVLLPVVMPKELWDESGRYSSIGSEMARFSDRNGHKMLLGMTHEEAAVHLSRNIIKSYDQLPYMIYQFQTKFRDEPRARAGLIRAREFTMKDAYSFHETQQDLEYYYNKCLDAYTRIFQRIGMNNFIYVGGDSGMMGGKVAHEFMALTDIGEDSLVLCSDCDYKANMEVATGILDKTENNRKPLEEVYTGDAKTIDEVCKLLNIKPMQTIKAVAYAHVGTDEIVLVFLRGDLEVNEAKLKNYLGFEVAGVNLEDSTIIAGNIGVFDIDKHANYIVFDQSLRDEECLLTGANRKGYHINNVCVKRDLLDKKFVDVSKVKEGESCPKCKKGILTLKRGVEIGNIFQLGTKYSETMNLQVHGRDGSSFSPIMGCYGIGIGRSLACVVEQNYDEKGIIWPLSIAPYKVIITLLRQNEEEVQQVSWHLEEQLKALGVDCLVDDREVSAGVKFADSELMGIPIRLVVSPRNISAGQIEVCFRRNSEKVNVDTLKCADFVKEYINKN